MNPALKALRPTLPTKQQFEDRVSPEPNSGCWLWLATLTDGRARLLFGNKQITAARAAYRIYKGEIPRGLLVCHSCDNPVCVNPDHLWLGTHADNSADMVRKGRAAKDRAVIHPKAKLTPAMVIELRNSDLSNAQLARKFNVDSSAISFARTGKTWRWVA